MSGFRTFGKFEKEVINEILDLDDKNLVVNAKNILSGLKEFGINLDFIKTDSDEFQLFFEKSKCSLQTEKEKEDSLRTAEKYICNFVLLMQYLIEEDYLLEIKDQSSLQNSSVFTSNIPLDKAIAKSLADIWTSNFKVSYTLTEIKHYNYKEPEAYNNDVTRCISILALIVDLLVGIASIKVSLCISDSTQKISMESIAKESVLSVKQAENTSFSIKQEESKSILPTQNIITIQNQSTQENQQISAESDKNGLSDNIKIQLQGEQSK